jgi:hypothetical protein
MVPLVHGDWAEVKTLVVGAVATTIVREGEVVAPTHALSYFSRLTDAESFQQLTLGELYRRGVETANQVAAVSDGAEWIQGVIDFHRPRPQACPLDPRPPSARPHPRARSVALVGLRHSVAH